VTVTTATLEAIERREHVDAIAQCEWAIEQGYVKTVFVTVDGENRLALVLTPAGREALKCRRMVGAEREIIKIVRRMVHDDLTLQHPGTNTLTRLKELLNEIEP